MLGLSVGFKINTGAEVTAIGGEVDIGARVDWGAVVGATVDRGAVDGITV